MKLNERLALLEQRKPDAALARIRAMSDDELDRHIAAMTPEQLQAAEEHLKLWLN